MSRFGVMKHLKLLEEAGLVVTKRQGREKLHFLNPVPIRLVHDRWVSKYAEPWAAALSDIKQRLETTMEKVFEIYISHDPGATLGSDHRPGDPEQVQLRRAHHLGLDARLALRDEPSGADCSARARTSRSIRRAGSCRACARSGATTSRARAPRASPGRSSPSATPAVSMVTHDQLREGANEQIYGGWPMILSGLKTWLETGELLTTPGSLMYR